MTATFKFLAQLAFLGLVLVAANPNRTYAQIGGEGATTPIDLGLSLNLDPNRQYVAFADFAFARNLAGRLTEGRYKNFRILNAIVVNDQTGYYIRIKLSSGQTLTLDQSLLSEAVDKEELELADNFLLIKDPNGVYQFFDRNRFHRLAFNAKVYIKLGGVGDPYHLIALPYGIRLFTLLPKNDSSKRQNPEYAYRIRLENGYDVYLTLAEAYQDFQRGAFISNPTTNTTYFRDLVPIDYILAKPVQNLANDAKSFSLEVRFQRPVIYQPSMIAFSISKTNDYGLADAKNYFYFDLYLPNASFDLKASEKVIQNFAFFDKVYLIQDPADKNRTIVRSLLRQDDIDFFDSPPQVAMLDNQTVQITFQQGVDQTKQVFVKADDDPKKKIQARAEANVQFSQTPYFRSFSEALTWINQQSSSASKKAEIDGLFQGLEMLSAVGTYAETKEQISEVVATRNETLAWLYDAVTSYVEEGLKSRSFDKKAGIDSISRLEPYIQVHERSIYLNQLKKSLLTP